MANHNHYHTKQILREININWFTIILNNKLNCALNIWLIAFPWKLYQICDHRFNGFLAITEIHQPRNNMGFSKKTKNSICGLSRQWNKSHHSFIGNRRLRTHWDLCKGQANYSIVRISLNWFTQQKLCSPGAFMNFPGSLHQPN